MTGLIWHLYGVVDLQVWGFSFGLLLLLGVVLEVKGDGGIWTRVSLNPRPQTLNPNP